MKRFEAIEMRIDILESDISPCLNDKQLLSELKQIRDEHSEMVEMFEEIYASYEKYQHLLNVSPSKIKQLLTKINYK